MSAKAKRTWAWSHRLPSTDLVTLLALCECTDVEGRGEFNPEELHELTNHGERTLAGSIHSLADKGLLKGPRWTAGRGWTTTSVRLAITDQRHLKVA